MPSIAYISEFSLINENGEAVHAGVLGLLINNGGTVCDDNFSDRSAEAICRKMGFMGKLSWTSGEKWGIQASKEITIFDVICTSTEWSSCKYAYNHNCGHNEDLFLQCDGVGMSVMDKINLLNLYYVEMMHVIRSRQQHHVIILG